MKCDAENLYGVQDSSVDVVTTGGVLAYVPDKMAALREFHRILKPGGRISLAEPVMMDEARATCALRTLVESAPPQDLHHFLPLMHRWKASQFPDTAEAMALCPMTNYSERDLVRYAQLCKFSDIHMELHIDVRPVKVRSWEVFVSSAPHPLAPPLSVILEQKFTSAERILFEKTLRPIVEAADPFADDKVAYLTAVKPKKT